MPEAATSPAVAQGQDARPAIMEGRCTLAVAEQSVMIKRGLAERARSWLLREEVNTLPPEQFARDMVGILRETPQDIKRMTFVTRRGRHDYEVVLRRDHGWVQRGIELIEEDGRKRIDAIGPFGRSNISAPGEQGAGRLYTLRAGGALRKAMGLTQTISSLRANGAIEGVVGFVSTEFGAVCYASPEVGGYIALGTLFLGTAAFAFTDMAITLLRRIPQLKLDREEIILGYRAANENRALTNQDPNRMPQVHA